MWFVSSVIEFLHVIDQCCSDLLVLYTGKKCKIAHWSLKLDQSCYFKAQNYFTEDKVVFASLISEYL